MLAWPLSANDPRQAAPALFTSRSSRPCFAWTSAATRPGASGSVRSAAITVAPPSSAASSSRRSSRRATRTSSAPGSRAKRFAVAAPIPAEAPVTSAITGSRLSQLVEERTPALWIRIGRQGHRHPGADIAVAAAKLGNGLLGGPDDGKCLDHLVVDQLGHLVPLAGFGHRVQLVLKIAPAMEVEHGSVGGG